MWQQAVELTDGCINPLLFSTSALVHLRNTVNSDVNYIEFSDMCPCVRISLYMCVRVGLRVGGRERGRGGHLFSR